MSPFFILMCQQNLQALQGGASLRHAAGAKRRIWWAASRFLHTEATNLAFSVSSLKWQHEAGQCKKMHIGIKHKNEQDRKMENSLSRVGN